MLRGVKTKTALFTFRLSSSGQAVHRAFATQGQEAFLEGHVQAFDELGGTPTVHVRYDNLKAAVSRVSFGRNRVESQRWVAFRSHYGFDAFYCQPGVDGAHEKGGVEGEGGRFRRTHCVPMPEVDSIAELNERLATADAKDAHRRIGNRAQTVGHDAALERTLLRPLPTEAFPTWLTLTPQVDRYARVTVRQTLYSVPARLIGRQVRVHLGSSSVTVFDGRKQIATHERVVTRGGQSLVLDHYLEVLARKPGALPGATALAQAGRRERSPRPTTRSGRWPAPNSATRPAHEPWSRCCCCTATSPPTTSRPDRPPPCGCSHRPPTWSPSRPAKPTANPTPGRSRSPSPSSAGPRSTTVGSTSPTTPSSSSRQTRGRCQRSTSTTSSSPAPQPKRRPSDEREDPR